MFRNERRAAVQIHRVTMPVALNAPELAGGVSYRGDGQKERFQPDILGPGGWDGRRGRDKQTLTPLRDAAGLTHFQLVGEFSLKAPGGKINGGGAFSRGRRIPGHGSSLRLLRPPCAASGKSWAASSRSLYF